MHHVVIEHLFTGISVTDYEALYFDQAFLEACAVELRVSCKIVRFDQTAKRIVRHICYEPERKPGDAVDIVYGKRKATFIEEIDYDRAARKGSWRTVPNQWAERVHNSGTIEFLAAPDGTTRILHGDVKISLFGFGRLVERAVVGEVEKSYETTARVTREWVAAGKRAARPLA